MLVWITKLDPMKFSNVELLIRIGILLSIKRSWNNVPFKCLNTIFKAMKCVWVSLYINWDNLLTIKLMSGLVCAKYYKEPNIFRNSSTSTGVVPSKSRRRGREELLIPFPLTCLCKKECHWYTYAVKERVICCEK